MNNKVRRCPRICHDPECPVCSGAKYVHSDGTPATAQEMLTQLTARGNALKLRRPTKFPRSRR